MMLKDLQAKAFETAKAKGWHDNDQLDENGMPTVTQFLAWIALAHSELAEAEAETAHHYVVDGKPEGKVVELADVVIRLWDDAGACGWNPPCDDWFPECSLSVNVALGRITEYARVYGVSYETKVAIYNAVGSCFDAAKALGYDFEMFRAVIEEKMAHNETRPHRHGGKLA